MITGRIFKNKFAADLNSIYYGGDSNIGIYFDTIRLHQFLKSLHTKIQQDNIAILDDIKGESPEIQSSMLNQIDIDNTLYYFPDLLLKSVLLISYSILETKLKEICCLIGTEYGLKDYVKYRHKATGKCDLMAPKEYLSVVVKADISGVDKLWLDLFNYKEIRKAILHKGSEISQEVIPEVFKSDPNISFANGVVTIMDPKFIEVYIDKIDNLFSNLVKSFNDQFNLVEIISTK